MIVPVVLLALAAFGGAFGDDYARRYGVAKNSYPQLFDKNAGASHCRLVQGLYDMCGSASFSASENTTFTSWVAEIETLVTSDVTLTVKQKTLKVAEKMLWLRRTYSDLHKKVAFRNITGWSVMSNFEQIAFEFGYESTLSLTVKTSGGSSCKLFDMLIAAANANGDATLTQNLQTFIDSKLKAIIMDSSKTNAEMVGQIYFQFMSYFFVTYPQYKVTVQGFSLQEFGSFDMFYQTSVTFYQESSIQVTMSGSGYNCPLIAGLNASLSDTTLSLSQRGQIKQMINYLIQQFQVTIDVNIRMQIVSSKFCEFIDLNFDNFFVFGYCKIQGFGIFYELIMYTIHGCCLPSTAAPEPTVPVTTPIATTEAVTTVPVTTAAPTTEAVTTEAVTTEAVTVEAMTTEAVTTETAETSFTSVTFMPTEEGTISFSTMMSTIMDIDETEFTDVFTFPSSAPSGSTCSCVCDE